MEPAGFYRAALAPHIPALADGLNGRDPFSPGRGNPGGQQYCNQAQHYCGSHHIGGNPEPKRYGNHSKPYHHIGHNPKGYPNAPQACQYTQRDAHHTDKQGFHQNHSTNLPPGCAHRGQQAKLPGALRNGDGKGVVNQGHGAEHNQAHQHRHQACKHGVEGAVFGYAGVQQHIRVGGRATVQIFQIIVNLGRVCHPEIHIVAVSHILLQVRNRQGGIAGGRILFKIRAGIDTHNLEGAGLADYQFLLRFPALFVVNIGVELI